MTHDSALSPLDATFLLLESESTPMHIASLGIFEGDPLRDASGAFRIEDARRLVSSRLSLVPKLRQEAYVGLLGEAPPVWLDDEEFDITKHVRLRHLPQPGTEAQLRELCADVMSQPLDRSRPLWELLFVDGLADGRIALIQKLHHSMADGLAAAELATVLLDLSPEHEAFREQPAWAPEPGQSMWRGAVEDLWRLAVIPLRVGRWGAQSVVHPIRRAKEFVTLGEAFSTIFTPRMIAPKSSINPARITDARSVDFVRLPFDEVHGIAKTFESTVNDVLLTLVTCGLHDLLQGRGELTDRSELQVLVPVGLVDAHGRGLGNDVSAFFVRLPVGLGSPLDVLRAVSADVRHEKGMHQEQATATLLRWLEPLPQDILSSVASMVQHQPFFNLVVTNVPGPRVPLYALGAKLEEAFPLVPLVGNLSFGVAALSYEGQLNLGILSDPVTCPDVKVFCDGVRAGLESLVHEAQAPTC